MRDSLRVCVRVLSQLARDPRFLAMSALVPVGLVLLLEYVVGLLPPMGIRMSVYAFPMAAFFVFFITYVVCTIVLVRERRDGTLERMFASGYRRSHVVAGYALGYGAVAAAQGLILFATTVAAFSLSLGSNAFAVLVTLVALSLVSIALGLFLSAVTRREGQVFPLIPLVIVPSLLVSGLIIPMAKLPIWLRLVGYAIPLTHAEAVLLGLLRDGHGLASVAGSLALLVGEGVALLGLAGLTLREQE